MQCWPTKLVAGLLLTAISTAPLRADPKTPPATDSAGCWESLFNGKDLAGWRIFNPHGGRTDPDAWGVEDGTLTRKGKGYLKSVGTYGDFVLDLEFKVGPETNSGIFVRFDPEYSAGMPRYWWNGALEVQLFDSFGRRPPTKQDCGALFDMVAPSENTMRAPGEWNRMAVTARGSRIEVELNGKRIVDADLDDWTTAGKNPDGSDLKYHKPMKDAPREGHILLQEHPGEVWFRNIRVKRLK